MLEYRHRLRHAMKMQIEDKQGVSHLAPYRAIFFALIFSFFVFLVLDQIEQLVADRFFKIDLRLCHFVRGFLSTFAGMSLVWLIMNRKEKELLKWRNHFAGELEMRTSELCSTVEARIEDMSRISAVLDSIAKGIIEVNQLGLVRSLNLTAVELLGLQNEDPIGTHLDFIIPRLKLLDATQIESAPSYEDLVSADERPKEFKYFSPNGSIRIFEWKASPMRSAGRNFGVVIALSDLGERYRMQSDLLQQRDDFVAVIKHRLQINILALKRVVALILDQVYGELQTQQQQTLSLLAETIEDTESVLSMLVDIYMYKNNQKQLDSACIDANRLLQKLALQLQEFFPRKSITMQKTQALLTGDEKALNKLFKHLLSNALKFAAAKVEVKCDLQNNFLKLQVIDDGPGIARGDQAQIFDRFFKESASGKHVPVTGLGLCLCREIVIAHGGSISCRSHEEIAKTTFEVLLPLYLKGSSKVESTARD